MARAGRILVVAGLLAVCGAQGPVVQPAPSDTQAPAEDRKERQRKAVEEARAAYDSAVHRSAAALAKLEAYVKALPSNKTEAKAAAAAIQRRAAERIDEEAKDADEAFRGRLSALQSAEDADAVAARSKEARRASEDTAEAGRRAAQHLRAALRDAKAARRSEVRSMGREAKAAAHEAYAAAQALERVQRHNGVKEAEYEREFGRHESATERMIDRAGDLPGDAEDAVGDFFDRVKEEVEAQAHAARDAAKAHAKDLEKEARAAEASARSRVAQAAASEAEPTAAEPNAEGGSASETTDESAGEGTKEQPKAEGEKTKKPQAGEDEAPEALAAAAPWRWTPMSSALLAMFVATSAATFAIRASAGRSARGQPLLG